MNELAALAVLAVVTGTTDVRDVVVREETLWVATSGGLVHISDHETRVHTSLDGLPDSGVRALLLHDETLWVGTDRGVARWDITRNQVGWQSASIRVRGLAWFADSLWVGANEGVYVLEDDRLTRRFEVTNVTALGATEDGLYITTAGSGTHYFNRRRLRRLRGDRLSWDVAVNGNDAWIATSQGIARYRAGRAQAGRMVAASRSLPIADVRAVAMTSGSPLLGTLGGGVLSGNELGFQPLSDQPALLRAANVQTIAVEPNGVLVVGTTRGLFVRREGEWQHVLSTGLPSNDLTSLASTREGLWVGTFNAGLALFRPDGQFAMYREAGGLLDDRINALAVDAEGDLWIATDRGVLERTEGQFRLRGFLDQHVFTLGTVGGIVHAGVGADLYAYRGGGFELVEGHPGRRPQDIRESDSGDWLIATAEGLSLRASDGWELFTSDDGLPDDWVTSVTSFNSATIVGTYSRGVARIRSNGSIETLRDDLWVNARALHPIRVGSTDVLAVGTLDDGLWLWDGATWIRYSTEEGLPDNDVTGILPDGQGGFWIATRGGLARMAIQPAQSE